MVRQRIGIIGNGYVGKATKAFFESKYDIVVHDPAQGLDNRETVAESDMAVICVPTPMQEDGSVDTRAVEETLMWLRTPAIVIKSTVPPGTTKKFAERFMLGNRLVFSPEYIGEGGYPVPHWDGVPHPTDMKLHQFHIFGGTPEATQKVIPFFQRVAGPFAQYHTTDSTTAELTKYAENAWIAAKVTFCNELYDIAKAFGVEYNKLRELWLLDGRVGRSHTLVYPEKRGFDGKCIPKDVYGLYRAAGEAGHESAFIAALLEINARFIAQNLQS